jgi:hypothetical protein
MTPSLRLPKRRAEGSLKLAAASAVGAVDWPAPTDGIGDGVAGGFAAAEAASGCGAGGGAGVDVKTDGVDGVDGAAAVFETAGAGCAFGWI